ncbi:MAG: hypothetical protein P8X47_11115 [Ignavibacteriaceae bacterium]
MDKEKYIEFMHEKLDEFNKKIDELENFIKSKKETSSKKYDSLIKEIRNDIDEKKKILLEKGNELSDSGKSALSDLKVGFEKASRELGEAIKDAKNKFK